MKRRQRIHAGSVLEEIERSQPVSVIDLLKHFSAVEIGNARSLMLGRCLTVIERDDRARFTTAGWVITPTCSDEQLRQVKRDAIINGGDVMLPSMCEMALMGDKVSRRKVAELITARKVVAS